MTNLTRHFTVSELIRSDTAKRLGLDNSPDAVVFGNLKKTAAMLEKIRSVIGRPIIVTSGYRSPAVNRAVDGSKTSSHLSGLAADIQVKGMSSRDLAKAIRDSGVEFDQLILEYDRWVHVSTADKPRGQVLTIRSGTGYMTGIV